MASMKQETTTVVQYQTMTVIDELC